VVAECDSGFMVSANLAERNSRAGERSGRNMSDPVVPLFGCLFVVGDKSPKHSKCPFQANEKRTLAVSPDFVS
jgi:hypothetical protein